jgi:hypothetical protein
LNQVLAQVSVSESIKAILTKEQQAMLNRDFSKWSSHWVNDGSIYYLKAIDGFEFHSSKALSNHFQKWMTNKKTSTSRLEQGNFEMQFNPDSTEAFISFQQNLVSPASIYYPDSNNRSFEIRTVKKIDEDWKIKRAISISHYHESDLPTAELFLNRSAFILFEQGKLEAAIAVSKSIVEAFPNSGTGYSLLIFLYKQSGDEISMKETAKAALKVFPDEVAFEALIKN